MNKRWRKQARQMSKHFFYKKKRSKPEANNILININSADYHWLGFHRYTYKIFIWTTIYMNRTPKTK